MKLISLFLLVSLSLNLFGQEGTDLQLAQYYFANGEFEKALPYCQKVYSKDNSKYNFKRYFECLLKTDKEKEAEKVLKKQINTNKEDFEYTILLGDLYQTKGDLKAADKVFGGLIDDYATNNFTVLDLYQAFKTAGKNELAFLTLEKGRKTFKDKLPLNIQFAEMYKIKGETDKMILEYIDLLEIESGALELVQLSISQPVDFSSEESKEYELIKEKLLSKIQKKPNETIYSEMLIWLFIQKKQFNAAINQAQALDKREQQEGFRVFEIGNICLQNKNYESARKAFKYVVSLGEDKQFYFQAEYALLNTRYTEITQQRNYSSEEIQVTID